MEFGDHILLGLVKWRKLVGPSTEDLLEARDQTGVIREHLGVAPIGQNLGLSIPCGQNRVAMCPAEESRNIVEPEERVAVCGSKQFVALDALDRMADSAVHDESVREQERGESPIARPRCITPGRQGGTVPNPIGDR